MLHAFTSRALSIFIVSVAGLLSPQSAQAAGFQTLYSFKNYPDANFPYGGLITPGKGNYFGTTGSGGEHGLGTIYEVTATGSESILYSFAGGNDGSGPGGSLVRDGKGNFYGTTLTGGSNNYCGQGTGCGTVFKFTAGGSEKILHAFAGGKDGGLPNGDLVSDANGDLYGTTGLGGIGANCGTYGCGTVFRISKKGREKVLYAFQGGTDGALPTPNLIIDASGNLYGTTSFNGNSCSCGTVFKLTPTGVLSTLYAFTGGNDGNQPFAGLVADTAGNLYGTTYFGGGTGCGGYGCGTVFKVTSGGSESVLYVFKGGNDGFNPGGSLVLDVSGNLYGTTVYGGTTNICTAQYVGCGTVFEISPTGNETILRALNGASDGAYPWGQLLLKNGTLYGTASEGGPSDYGTVFELPK